MYLNSLLSTSAPENCQMCQETDGWKRLPQGLAANRWHLALAEDQVFLGTWQMAGKLMELFMGKCTVKPMLQWEIDLKFIIFYRGA
jgi:hypothetical protein